MTILISQGVLLLPNVRHGKNIVVSNYHVSHPNMHLHTFFKKHSKTQFLKPSIFRPYSPCVPKKHDCFRPSAALESLENRVTIHRTSLIFPIEEAERKTMFLSNIDKCLNYQATAIFFFSRNPKFSFEQIVTKLENALRKLLVQYDFMAGRLRWNIEGQLAEIDCNAAGAGFVVASCNSSLEELGGIGSSNVTNQKFALEWNALPDDQPLLVVQVTLFQCGGFALSVAVNRVTLDGISIRIFLENLASLLSKNDFVIHPYSNRQLLAARSPLRVTFPHPEMFNFESLQGNISNKTLLKATFQKLDSKYFQLSLSDIMNLKNKSRISGEDNSAHSTDFNVVAAHIWKCVAEAKNPENDPERQSTILHGVNIRSRVKPRLPSSYAGNAIFSVYSTTTFGEIKKRPFSHLVEMVFKAETRITDEYIRSAIDWLELYKGFPYGDAIISSWWNMGLDEIDFPWGRSKWSCPAVPNHGKNGNNAIILLPEFVEGKQFKGLHVLVSLPQKEMKIFEGLFYALLW